MQPTIYISETPTTTQDNKSVNTGPQEGEQLRIVIKLRASVSPLQFSKEANRITTQPEEDWTQSQYNLKCNSSDINPNMLIIYTEYVTTQGVKQGDESRDRFGVL